MILKFSSMWRHVTSRVLMLMVVVGLGVACAKESPEVPNPDPGPSTDETVHTVMAYLPGTSLLSFYLQNIQAMCEGAKKDALKTNRLLICYQPDGANKATILEVMNNGTEVSMTRKVKSYNDFEASDPECVATVFEDMIAEAPAKSYGVVIGSHGKAWVPSSDGALGLPAKPGYNLYWQPAEGALPTRSFGDTRHELDITDLATILDEMSVRPDYLIFDACFMANIETLYDLRHCVDYVVASPCEVMGTGFPYDRIMPVLLSEESAKKKMEQTCFEFFDSFNTQSGIWQSACVSLTVTSELEALAGVVKKINAGKTQLYDPEELQIYDALSEPLFFDLGDYMNQYCGDEQLLAEFEAQMAKAFPSESRLHTPGFYSAYNNRLNPIDYYTGVTVSEPSKQFVTSNQMTEWYKNTH